MDTQTEQGRPAGGSFLFRSIGCDDVFTPEEFTSEHRLISDTMDKFIEREVLSLGPAAKKLDYGLARALIKKAGDVGLLGACLPEEYGGLGLNGIRFALIKEKLSTGAPSITMAVGGQVGIGMLPIIFFGTPFQRAKYLPLLLAGTHANAFALTEPWSGTDASSIRASAKLSEDGTYYTLNGNKVFITNAGFADIFVVFAKIPDAGFSAFIVERDSEGLSVGPEEQKMGLKASSTCSVSFDDVKVPAENLLGKPGEGHLFAFNVLNFGRLSVGAGCLGNTKEALDLSVKYANQRVQFKRKISSFPLIGKKLAEMNIKAFVLESMVYRTADLIDAAVSTLDFSDPDLGDRSRKAIGEYMLECAIDKVFGSEVLDFAADEGVQIHGGYGYMQEYKIEEIYRDSRIKRILEGTNEINRLFITNTITRKLARGELPDLQAALDRAPEPRAPAADGEGVLGPEEAALGQARNVYYFALKQALARYGSSIDAEQEVCSDLADIVIQVFALESALLRTRKLVGVAGETRAQNALDMTSAFASEACEVVAASARNVLCTCGQGEKLASHLASLEGLLARPASNATELKRRIAAKVIDRERYVV